jgi:hypothetical protein
MRCLSPCDYPRNLRLPPPAVLRASAVRHPPPSADSSVRPLPLHSPRPAPARVGGWRHAFQLPSTGRGAGSGRTGRRTLLVPGVVEGAQSKGTPPDAGEPAGAFVVAEGGYLSELS